MANDEKKIPQDVAERLDKMDWESLKKSSGVTREAVEANPRVARQLAYGQKTELVFGNTPEVAGLFSLRAFPQGKDDQGNDLPYRIKSYTMEQEKTIANCLRTNDKNEEYSVAYFYAAGQRNPITSPSIVRALLEKTNWVGSDGENKYGLANANAGKPVAAMIKDRDGNETKQYFLVSYFPPTNTFEGISVDAVKRHLENSDLKMYGVKINDAQKANLAEGKAVFLKDCTTKDGRKFDTCVQFDAAQRQLVPAHPAWMKQMMAAGVEVNVHGKEQKAEQRKAAPKAQKTEQKAEKKETRMKVK